MHNRLRWRLSFAVTALLLTSAALVPQKVAAASCSGQSHHVVLSTGAVSPGSGSTSTTFRFSVMYADNAGCSPDRIEVVIAGFGRFAMGQVGGDLQAGATFRRDLTLPAGEWTYRFETTSGVGSGLETATLTAVSPRSILVTSPTPKPTPDPTPKPTPVPTPKATARPIVTPAPPLPTPTPTPDATPAPAGSPSPGTSPSPSPGASGQPSGGGGTGGPGASPPSDTATSPAPASSTSAPGGAAAAATSAPGLSGGGSVNGTPALTALDFGHLPRPLLSLAVAGAGTTLGLFLFMLLGFRLLDLRPNYTLRPVGAGIRRSRRTEEGRATGAPPADGPGSPRTDSVKPAPVGDPATGAEIGRAPLTFGLAAPAGVDRGRIASRLVPVRSEPDEACYTYGQRLDVGDEVDVLRQDGPWCLIRTPSGVEGWVPGLTLTSMTPRSDEDSRHDR